MCRYRNLFALIVGATLTMDGAMAQAGTAGFFDNFDSVDRATWYVSDGWTNGEHQGCIWKADQVSVDSGVLRLALTKTPATSGSDVSRDYVCGELQTNATFGDGLYETRMRATAGSGLVSAFFTYIGPVNGKPHDEIDVEVLGSTVGSFDANYFVDGEDKSAVKVALVKPADSTFVNYAFERTPTRLRWFVNGTLVREVKGNEQSLPSEPQKIFFSLWNGGKGTDAWLGKPDPSITETSMEVDYVGFTPAGQRCLFPESITCKSNWSTTR